ncbi:MAG: chaperone NapD [Thermoanaerobacteraceae bacterium]|nr:chaperone NapD [Thermoanaerobacteraceae bacterium]
MTITSIIIKHDPAKQDSVVAELQQLPGLSVEARLPGQVIAVLEVENLKTAHDFVSGYIEGMDGVWGAYPAYVFSDEDAAEDLTACGGL